ncbi:MAG: DUF748 domain-containing protein, partial [Deltaproteobacteria bacterium]|nr:DUF748 domain-containing protein [Candidatus Anaeroferrophillacea bacterium]
MDKTSASPPPSAPPPRPGRSRRRRRFFFVIGALVLLTTLYAAFGYLLLPKLIRDIGGKKITAALGRKAVIERVAIDPFRLTAEIIGLTIQRRDAAGPLLAVDRLFADFQAAALFKRALIVRQLDVQGPLASLTRNPDASFNFSDLLPAHDGSEAQAPDGQPFRFSINNISLSGGTIEFDDRPMATRHRLTSLHLTLPVISNLKYHIDTFVQPSLTCLINDTPVNLGGRTKPFHDTLETRFDLVLNNLDLPFYLGYLPGKRNFTLTGGSLSTNLAMTFIQPPAAPARLELSGTAGIRNLALTDNADKSFHFLDLPALTADFAPGNLLAGECNIAAVKLARPRLTLHRRADGTLRLPELNPAAADNTVAPAAAAPTASGSPAAGRETTSTATPTHPDASAAGSTPAAAPAAAAAGTAKSAVPAGTARTAVAAGAAPTAPAAPGDGDKPFLRLTMAKLLLTEGTVAFSDATPPGEPFTATLTPVTVEISGFATAGELPAALVAELLTDAGERLTVKGEFSLSPLTVTAAATLEHIPLNRYRPYYRPFFHGDIESGTADLTATLNLRQGTDERFRIDDGRLRLADLIIRHPAGAELIALPVLNLEGVVIDIPAREITAASLTGTDGRVQVERRADGSIDIMDLRPPAGTDNPAAMDHSRVAPGTTPGTADADRNPSPAAATPWHLGLEQSAIEDFAVTYTDRGPGTPAVIGISGLDLGLTGLSTRPETPADLRLACRTAQDGTLTAAGRVQLAPLTVDLNMQLAGLPARTAQPWISDHIDLVVTDGSLTANGLLRRRPEDGGNHGGDRPATTFSGSAAIDNLKTVGGRLAEEVVSWRRVAASGIDFSSTPTALKIKEIAVDEPDLRIAVLADGSTTIQALRVHPVA